MGILALIVKFEIDIRCERQIAKVKERGVRFGRKAHLSAGGDRPYSRA